MVSKEQKEEMLRKLLEILRNLSTSNSIKEISEKTKIPTSTIQRYLNKKELIYEVLKESNCAEFAEQTIKEIEAWLQNNKTEGLKRGGTTSQERHGYSKDETGHFIGSRKSK